MLSGLDRVGQRAEGEAGQEEGWQEFWEEGGNWQLVTRMMVNMKTIDDIQMG